jgi:hypothetical protein
VLVLVFLVTPALQVNLLSDNRVLIGIMNVFGKTCLLSCSCCSLARGKTEGCPVLVSLRTRGSM